ncbi:axin [Sitodiplosis mosellana]|uniref:axin n=1 Tax=Sitodiplosis mosellana TaxID=263140 RepID=UPI0024450F5C|nr:axin [Sitodiplosis mosellana]XP_055311082.1 axin [Sitodiplosis mosellana]XP_055311091.1 axin [Sitodiplosis mosellana]XP_055311101.1 axin [Sitodiplosis mosellana]XP_055311109.1 axin [Sitodiplosis mosellana]
MSQTTKKQSNEFNEYDSGNGPRPPVPGKESEATKMTTEGASNSTSSSNSNSNRSPDAECSFSARIRKWQESFGCLLADNEGVELLLKFVEEEAGLNSIHYIRLKLYFAVEGLKLQREEKIIRKLIRRISDEITRGQIEISPELRTTITGIVLKKSPPNTNIFDDLQQQLKETIASSSYRTFLLSAFFIDYVEEQKKKYEPKPRITAASLASAMNNVAVASSSADGATGFSRPMTVELSPLLTSSNLQTLHEDAELTLSKEPTLTKTTTDRPMPKLTEGLLLVTQNRRLEVRPEGAHGYTYNVPLNSSFNPVSRQGSEQQSCSSASLTDSEVNSKDGKPYFHRRPMPIEDMRKCMNGPIASHKTAVYPLAQGSKERTKTPPPISKSKMEQASHPLDAAELCKKLTALKEELDKKGERLHRILSDKLQSAQPREFPLVEEDDQSILDHHVSRVFSPGDSTPGNESPRHLQKNHHRSNEMSSSTPDFATQQQMRHSRSIPEHAGLFGSSKTKVHNMWSSQNIDSGIDSLYAATAPYRAKETRSIEQWSNETMRKTSKEDSRKTRNKMPPPPSYQACIMPTSFSHQTNSLPRMHEEEKHFTLVVYNYEDEKIPYRSKIPTIGNQLTLKQYKEHLPKKGNYRFYFITTCDDPESPIIQEEVTDDMDLLPLHDGKVCGYVKSIN